MFRPSKRLLGGVAAVACLLASTPFALAQSDSNAPANAEVLDASQAYTAAASSCTIASFRDVYPANNVNSSTFAFGVDSLGNIVGAADAEFPQNDVAVGIIRSTTGSIRQFQFPGSSFTYLQSRNKYGTMVGYTTSSFVSEGFRLHGSSLTKIKYPGAADTFATGINNYGAIVGYATGSMGSARFGWVLRSGTFTKLHYPGSAETAPMAIGDNGEIVGVYTNAIGGLSHGFAYVNGTYKRLDYPGAADTFANGVNKYGVVVGFYYPSSPGSGVAYGFIYRNGTFSKFVFTGAALTQLGRINNSGELVGSESKDGNVFYGFKGSCQ